MLFREVIGQKKAKEILLRTVAENHISHAQLFFGPEGSGNLALALAYAQYLLCTNRTDKDSCGLCPSCNKVQKLIHPDLHFVFPVAGPKEPVSDDFINQWRLALTENPYLSEIEWYEKIEIENKQGIINKHESDVIIKKVNLKTFESEYKVMIIWLPENMNHHSANRLLKIIEEPPEKTIFLLASNNTEAIIPTLLSRTQIVRLQKISTADMAAALKSRFTADAALLENAAHVSDGNFNNAVAIIKMSEENRFNFEQFQLYMQLSYKSVTNERLPELVRWIEEMAKQGREKQKRFFYHGLRMIRECLILNIKSNDIVYLTQTEYNDFCMKFSNFIHPGNAVQIANELNMACHQIEMNGYDKIILMDTALRIGALIRN